MSTTYKIENLTEHTVSIKVVIVEDNGKKTKMRRSYCNSNYDRDELQGLLSAEAFQQIISVWGDTPTVEDLPDPRIPQEENEEEK